MASCEVSHRIAITVLAVGLLSAFLMQGASCGEAEIELMLREFADDYTAHGDSITLIVGLDFSASGSWYVVVPPGGKADLHEGSHPDAAFTISMSPETLERIYRGSITAFTAAAQATGSDPAPLQLEVREPAHQLLDPRGTMLGFVQHFLVIGQPERTLLREENSRVVHGAHAIPLYYSTGFRSAWYKVKEGQRLNEPGDTNPYPQAFIIISGRGRAKIGESEVQVQAGEAYYIPPDADHVLWPERGDELVIIWLAWGEGA